MKAESEETKSIYMLHFFSKVINWRFDCVTWSFHIQIEKYFLSLPLICVKNVKRIIKLKIENTRKRNLNIKLLLEIWHMLHYLYQPFYEHSDQLETRDCWMSSTKSIKGFVSLPVLRLKYKWQCTTGAIWIK